MFHVTRKILIFAALFAAQFACAEIAFIAVWAYIMGYTGGF